tara:strand:- start:7765 stop:9315 length:1551 start_codon:yes stop_codon:yes gene_type:complete
MSANEGDEGFDDTEITDELQKVVKGLAEQVERLTKLMEKQAKATEGSTKSFHKTVDEQKELIKAQGDMVKENLRYRKSLQDTTSSMQMFTGLLSKGATMATVFSAISSKGKALSQQYEQSKEDYNELTKTVQNLEKAIAEETDPSKREELGREMTQKQGEQDEAKEKMDEGMGKNLSKLGEFADKHKTGILLGAGAAGTLLKVLKMAFDASPMFQQMSKMLKFGVMMILRPIGDFFGFIMRPIMIMLLRKFIIPWYTKMYPVMIEMGNLIGQKLAGAFEALAEGDVSKAFALLFKDVDFKQILVDMTQGIRDWVDNTDWAQVQTDIANALIAFGTGIWDYVLEPLGTWAYDELKKWWDDGIESINANWNNYWLSVYAWFAAGVGGIEDSWNKFWTGVWEWFSGGIKTIGANWTGLWTTIWNWIMDGIRAIPFIGDMVANGLGGGIEDGRHKNEDFLGGLGNGIMDFLGFGNNNNGGNTYDQSTHIEINGGNSMDNHNTRATILEAQQVSSSRRNRR